VGFSATYQSIAVNEFKGMPYDFSARAVSALARHDYIMGSQKYKYAASAIVAAASIDPSFESECVAVLFMFSFWP
jgi:hypothetical protein